MSQRSQDKGFLMFLSSCLREENAFSIPGQ